MKNRLKLENGAALAALSTFALLSVSCATRCSINPPPQHLVHSTELSGKAAAEIQQLNAKGELAANWKRNVDNQFSALDDDNAAYYMLLEAIDCQSQKGDKQLARQMFETLDREMAARRDPRARSARAPWTRLAPEVRAKRAATEEMLR